jgi:hypothetical protein
MSKYFYVIITVLAFSLVFCNKHSDSPIDSTDTSKVTGTKYTEPRLIGKWKWLNTKAVSSGQEFSPNTTGYTAKIEFPSDTIFNAYRNDTCKLHTHYHLLKAKSIYDNQLQLLIVVDSAAAKVSYVFSGGDTLLLRQECTDCFIEKYVKMTMTQK